MKRKIHTFAGLFVILSFAILIAIIFLYVTVIISGSSTQITLTDISQNWKTYSNLTNNFSVRYPQTWQVSENSDVIKFTSPDFSYGATPQKKIEKGFFISVRVLPINSVYGYSGDETVFATKRNFQYNNYNMTEYVVKNVDEVTDSAPAEIQFKTDKNLVLVDGWFSSQNQDLFLNIFQNFAQSFKGI